MTAIMTILFSHVKFPYLERWISWTIRVSMSNIHIQLLKPKTKWLGQHEPPSRLYWLVEIFSFICTSCLGGLLEVSPPRLMLTHDRKIPYLLHSCIIFLCSNISGSHRRHGQIDLDSSTQGWSFSRKSPPPRKNIQRCSFQPVPKPPRSFKHDCST